jgi:Primase X
LKNPNRWPRSISTKESEGRQIAVYSKYEALSYYEESDYLDCRISAYGYSQKNNSQNDNLSILIPKISLLMIDLDLSKFNFNLKSLDLAKAKIMSKIHDTFSTSKNNFEPTTILWTGNGYHLYIPAESEHVLENMPEFKKFKEPSKDFLRFAEYYLSNGKADSEHYNTVSFRNCMLRIPGSVNSKNCNQVKIVQKWNGTTKVPIDLLYSNFLAYLIDQGVKVTKQVNGNLSCIARRKRTTLSGSLPWIEILLQTPLPKFRKYCIWRILAPYLINVKHLSFEESFDRIDKWLDKCNELEALDFDMDTKINDCLNSAVNKGYLPISFNNPLKEPMTLKTNNRELYDLVKDLILNNCSS